MIEKKENAAIRVEGLTRRYGLQRALRGISLEVGTGENVIVLGPNGAGKTTLLMILANVLRPSSGTVHVAGTDIGRDAAAIRRRIGLVSHQTFLYADLTVRENLRFYGRMYGVSGLERRIGELAAQVGITPRLDERVRALSRGMQQRASIARAVLHDPEILLFDEPETGLDFNARSILTGLYDRLREGGRTTLTTTHDIHTALDFGSRVIILDGGRIVLDESLAGAGYEELVKIYKGVTGAA